METDQLPAQRVYRLPSARLPRLRTLVARTWLVIVCTLALAGLGSAALPASEARLRMLGMYTAGYGFDLLGWEVDALGEKLRDWAAQPGAEYSPTQQAEVVRRYMARADQMRLAEEEMNRVLSEGGTGALAGAARMQRELQELRRQQQAERPAAEQIIQRQVGQELREAGFGLGGRVMPPVQFTFTEPPKKLIVSPRDRITTLYSRMLTPEISLEEIERKEQAIQGEQDVSAYVTHIGGLGAFPTMVVDRASLPWVLSTVAHEWVHNYLAFFPLGWSYFASGEMTTLNETVAEIVGNEIGHRALQRHYLEPAQPETPDAPATGEAEASAPLSELLGLPEPLPFDFRSAMRETRLTVDLLLAQGRVDEAEAYMEERRQFFVENGVPLRVLNQAYFAFHGSYGTSAASTSPIGPKLDELRSLTPSLRDFLHAVRTFTAPDDLDRALDEWRGR